MSLSHLKKRQKIGLSPYEVQIVYQNVKVGEKSMEQVLNCFYEMYKPKFIEKKCLDAFPIHIDNVEFIYNPLIDTPQKIVEEMIKEDLIEENEKNEIIKKIKTQKEKEKCKNLFQLRAHFMNKEDAKTFANLFSALDNVCRVYLDQEEYTKKGRFISTRFYEKIKDTC